MENLCQTGFGDFELNLTIGFFRFNVVFSLQRSKRVIIPVRACADGKIAIQIEAERILFERVVIPHDFRCIEDRWLSSIGARRHTALEWQVWRKWEKLSRSPHHVVVILVYHRRKQIRYVQIYFREKNKNEIGLVNNGELSRAHNFNYLFQYERDLNRNRSVSHVPYLREACCRVLHHDEWCHA